MSKVGAPYGNKNAEKWTFRKAIQLFKDAIELTQQIEQVKITDKSGNVTNIIEVYKYDFIGEIAAELGTYHQMITQHLPTRFKALQRLKKQLDNNIERNCYINTKKGNIREATGIVNLRSNWKWTDRNKTDLSGELDLITKVTFID